MESIISIIEDKCVGCGACVRECPVSGAMTFGTDGDGSPVVSIDEEKCISCGRCVHACTHNAVDFEDDTQKFFKTINEKRVVLIVSPAIRTAFPDTWQSILNWLRQEGVYAIYDMSLGGDISVWANMRLLEQEKIKSAVSSHCPAVVNYITKYEPQLAGEMLSPVYSPAACTAVWLKTYMKITYAMAVLSPCPAVRTDPAEQNLIDFNVTFRRLEETILRKRVKLQKNSESTVGFTFDGEQGTLGCIMARPGGLRDNIWARNADLNVCAASGTEAFGDISGFGEMSENARPALLDLLSCDGGCVFGPCMDWETSRMTAEKIMHDIDIDARTRRKSGITSIVSNNDKQFKKFDDIFNIKSFLRTYQTDSKAPAKVTDADIKAAFEKMGFASDKQQKFNCRACGYESCRKMAEAVAAGGNIPGNCIVYARMAGGGNAVPVTQAVSQPEPETVTVTVPDTESRDELLRFAELVGEKTGNITGHILEVLEKARQMCEISEQASSKSDLVSDVLSKIIGFCSGSAQIGESELPVLVSTLEKLQGTLDNLNDGIKASVVESEKMAVSLNGAVSEADLLRNESESIKANL